MKKRFLSILTAAALCMSTVGVSVLADEEEYEDFTEGVTLTCNGEVVTEDNTYDFDGDGGYDSEGNYVYDREIVFWAYARVDEEDTYTFELLDSDGVAADDTVVTLCYGTSYYNYNTVDVYDLVSISGSSFVFEGGDDFGELGFCVSSESLGIITYVGVEYFTSERVEDCTEDIIVYCNGSEVTSIGYAHIGSTDWLEKYYIVDMEIGEIYELQIFDRSTGEIVEVDEDSISFYPFPFNKQNISAKDNILTITATSDMFSGSYDGEVYVYDYNWLWPGCIMINLIEPTDILLGDVNQDGSVDYLDAMQVLRYDAELIELDEDQLAAGDVNDDGEVNSLDAILILRYDAGLIDSFE